jgi:3-dehydroquinate dehydratase
MEKSRVLGADAFGIQFCKLKAEYRNVETYKALFKSARGLPAYVTNYRHSENTGKGDDNLADELLELADCGAVLCDVMGDYFDSCPGELTMNENAIKKQMNLIDELHKRGAEVLMSSHVLKFTPADEVLKIAKEHERRGADISKIVVGAENMAEQIENLRIINLLKQKLDIPFLFLAGGESRILRRIGGALGCCMYLCVHEYDSLATKSQPLLCEMTAIREYI